MTNGKRRGYFRSGLALILTLAVMAGCAVTALGAADPFQSQKQALVERVLALNGQLDAAALSALTDEELRDLIRTGAPGMPVGCQAAFDAALAYAGVAQSDVSLIDVDPELDEYTPYYDVELMIGGREYDYTVAAYTGQVLYGEKPADSAAVTAAPAVDITQDGAVTTALRWDALPVDSAALTGTPRVKMDRDDGQTHYDVTFETDAYGYEYEIDAATGEVLSVKIERLYNAGGAGDIGEDAALAAAMAHAGLTQEQVTWSECKRDVDDGRLEYEVDMRTGNGEYEYTIDGTTGAVLEYERD